MSAMPASHAFDIPCPVLLCCAALRCRVCCVVLHTSDLEQIAADLAAVGQPAPVAISATTGDGLADLYQLLQPLVDGAAAAAAGAAGAGEHAQRPPPGRQQQRQKAGSVPLQHEQQQRYQAVSAAAADVDLQLGEADLADAAAAEQAAVDALVQQHLAAAAAREGEAAAAADPASSSSSSEVDFMDDESSEGLRNPEDDSGSLGPLRLAILGLPNVGKSTLMNVLLGYERSLTGVCG